MQYSITVPDDLGKLENLSASLAELQTQLAPIIDIFEKMTNLLEAQNQIEDGIDRVNQVLGRQMGDPWEQPSSSTPYSLGWQVTHEDFIWVSEVPSNIWEPGVACWAKLQVESDEILEWDKDVTYKVGDKALRYGHIWEAKIEHGAAYQGTWGPSAATHSIWTDLGPA